MTLQVQNTRACSKCGSSETYKHINRYRRKDGTMSEYTTWDWYRDGYGGFFCKKCYCIWICNPRYFVYKDKIIYSDKPQKIGVCNFCRAVVGEINAQTGELCNRTNMAHFEYDDGDPEAHRLELCNSCHKKYDWGIPPDRKCFECGSMTSSRDWYRVNGLQNEFRCRKCHERERRRRNHAIKSMRKLDVFFGNKEEEEQKVQVVAATVPAPVTAAAKTIRCDDCNRLVPAEEVKVWLAPVAVGAYEGEQDPVYMCRKCTKIFLDDNKEEGYHFEDLLYSMKDAVRKYTPDVLEEWK